MLGEVQNFSEEFSCNFENIYEGIWNFCGEYIKNKLGGFLDGGEWVVGCDEGFVTVGCWGEKEEGSRIIWGMVIL